MWPITSVRSGKSTRTSADRKKARTRVPGAWYLVLRPSAVLCPSLVQSLSSNASFACAPRTMDWGRTKNEAPSTKDEGYAELKSALVIMGRRVPDHHVRPVLAARHHVRNLSLLGR